MIIFIHTIHSSFVNTDLEIIKKYFGVYSFRYPLDILGKSFWSHFRCQLTLLFFLIRRTARCDGLYIWFADYHSFLPVFFGKIFNKKSFLVLGGYDVTYIPELKYGSFSNPLRAFCAGFSIRYADYLLPVDRSLTDEARQRVRKIGGKIVPLPTGYDPQKWICDQNKNDLVLTVSTGNSYQRIKLKGIDFFIAVAATLPEYEFYIIGLSAGIRQTLPVPANVKFFDAMPQPELRKYYSSARVYAQFSLKEGLPNAVCEAMLCECIPVGSNVNGIPAAIGDCGYILYQRQVEQARELIQQAMHASLTAVAPTGLRTRARMRIQNNFALEFREQKIVSLLKNGENVN
jgi:glycosyltransferase involved in cell wall biosynthesis